MARLPRASWVTALALMTWGLAGCTTSSSPTAPAQQADSTSTATEADSVDGTRESWSPTGSASTAAQTDAAGIPKIELMTEVDGISIPRLKTAAQSLQLTGQLPADVFNDHARRKPGEKTTGDAVVIRFNSEPKTLNAITETSAVHTYIMIGLNGGNVSEPLLRQNPETFDFEPHIASKWITEDSIKLHPDYPGKERRVALEGGQPAVLLEIDYVAPDKGSETPPQKMDLKTYNAAGEMQGRVWVGVFPVGRIAGAPITGYHEWSDEQGRLTISGMPTGKYVIKVGAEVFGQAMKGADGSLTVTAATVENPLHAELEVANQAELKLQPEQWIDLQRETYYTFYLRNEATWSDGVPFTTKDLAFAYACLNNATVDGDSLRTYYQDLVECTPVTPHVVRMRYRQQYFKAIEFTAGLGQYTPPFHVFARNVKEQLGRELTLDRLTPDEEAAQKKLSAHGTEFGRFFNTDPTYNREPLGTGPYTVHKWERGDRVELVRNPNYWNKDRPAYLDKIIVRFIANNVTAMQALNSGEIDFFWSMSPEQYFEDLKGPPDWFQGKYVKATWFTPMFYYFGWNMLKPEFQDRRVRIALSLLFDKQSFLDQKLFGEAAIVSGPQYYFGPGYDHSVEPIGYDLDTARDLLAEAGWVDTDNDGILDKDGRSMEFDLPISLGNPVALQIVQVFQKNAKSAGIQVEIQNLEWASFLDKLLAKDYDICMLRWVMPPEGDPFQIWHSSGAGKESRGSNHVSFDNPIADELIEQIRLTLNPQQRYQIHHAFHRLVDSEQPYLFLFCPKEFGAYHQRFRGVKWYRLRPGFDLTAWYVPKDEQLHN